MDGCLLNFLDIWNNFWGFTCFGMFYFLTCPVIIQVNSHLLLPLYILFPSPILTFLLSWIDHSFCLQCCIDNMRFPPLRIVLLHLKSEQLFKSEKWELKEWYSKSWDWRNELLLGWGWVICCDIILEAF